jgi:hypothetical protein
MRDVPIGGAKPQEHNYNCPHCNYPNSFPHHISAGERIVCFNCSKGFAVTLEMTHSELMPRTTPVRNGSPVFYAILEEMGKLHSRKSYDYASSENPYGNYEFAGQMSQLFDNSKDAGFVGRIGEKLFRLANLENNGKYPNNESIQDTETDLCVIMTLWIASRRERRMREGQATAKQAIESFPNGEVKYK